MKAKVTGALLIGLLVGMLLGTILPVNAGTPRTGSGRRLISLERRVTRLEAKAQHLTRQGVLDPKFIRTTRCASGAPAVWQPVTGIVHALGC